jgi:hypothetical protein
MPPSRTDPASLDAALRARERVLTHRVLRALGVPPATITRRIGPGGLWQRLLPGVPFHDHGHGVVLAHLGTPTRRERLLGALSFAGPGALITGYDAARAQGIEARRTGCPVDVLVPEPRQLRGQQPSSRLDNQAATWSRATRSCTIVSRSRIVTA